jgi:competence protein ComEC
MQFFRRFGLHICLVLLALATLAIWLTIFSQPKPGELVVAVLDIGQGDSIYIKSPTGVEVLIDGGPDSSLLRELPKVMSYGDRTLDAVIATHPDADHIGGLVDLLPRYTVKHFIEPGIQKSTATAAKLQQEVDAVQTVRVQARRGMRLELGGGAWLEILFPDFDVSSLPDNKVNEGCVVARLTYKNSSALFMCDAPFKVEEHLLAEFSSTTLQNDLLKIGHHGSKYSSGNAFLAAVGATAAVVSAGESNRYGHPTNEALGRVYAHGAKIYRTDVDGTVIFVSNGERFIKR